MKWRKTGAAALAGVMLVFMSGCGAFAPAGSSDGTAGADREFVRGTVSGDVFTSEFAGLSFTLPEGWSFYSDEQLSELGGITADLLEGEDGDALSEAMESGQVIYDFFASSPDGLSTVNVTVEDLSATGNSSIGESAYAGISKSRLADSFESMGFSLKSSEKTTVTLAGTKHSGIEIAGEYSERLFYETVVCVKVGKYMYNVSACTWGDNAVSELLSAFAQSEERQTA